MRLKKISYKFKLQCTLFCRGHHLRFKFADDVASDDSVIEVTPGADSKPDPVIEDAFVEDSKRSVDELEGSVDESLLRAKIGSDVFKNCVSVVPVTDEHVCYINLLCFVH